ncbi:hypothetical protein BX616_000302, partial [Lobosporangium transversale]
MEQFSLKHFPCTQYLRNKNDDHASKSFAYDSTKQEGNVFYKTIKTSRASTSRSSVTLPLGIFERGVARVAVKYNLPYPGAYLDSNRHLVYCLGLLSSVPIPITGLTVQEQEWSLATSSNLDEHERLRDLVSDMIAVFISDGAKTEATITEALTLAPTLNLGQFRTLLLILISGIGQDTILDTHLLEGLAQLIQHAPPGYLDSDDLTRILALSPHLHDAHEYSDDHLYRLAVAVSHVLDTMVNNQVKGLKREKTYMPLTAYLKRLQDSSDPYLVLRGYGGTASLHETGATFKQCVEKVLSFSRKTAWYPVLRGADILLQRGELAKFKILACKVSCRLDLAFQWGLCQRLGHIASDPQWAMDTRRDAVAFLGEIYKNDRDYFQIKQWILHVLRKLASSPVGSPRAANALLNTLKREGGAKKQELYKSCLQEPNIQYPFTASLPPSVPSSLLGRVQEKLDTEKRVGHLKQQRINNLDGQSFYIPQYAKANAQARHDDLFLLMGKSKEFLDGDQKVLLVQGIAGAGKSTFNRTLESTLWKAYQKRHGRIPLFIDLPAIEIPEEDFVAKQLQKYGFTEAQIMELKLTRSFVLICDGYDESKLTSNLYVSNQLNQTGGWVAQLVISCRSEYLRPGYLDFFCPMDHNYQANATLFQEAVIAPFSKGQVNEYINRYIANMDPVWQPEDYQHAIKAASSLLDIVKNPFLLSLSLEILPEMVASYKNISKTEIKRVSLYDQHMKLWIKRREKQLSETIGLEDRRIFQKLSEEGFAQNEIRYLTELAIAIYKHQNGNPVVDYTPIKDKSTWKERFFSRENGKSLLREVSPLVCTGSQYHFVHHSILEYSLTRAIYEPLGVVNAFTNDEEAAAASTSHRWSIGPMCTFGTMELTTHQQVVDAARPSEDSPLAWKSFINEPSILQFLEERARLEPVFKEQLHTYIELSKSDRKWRTAATNAITILILAGESFIKADLRGVQIPGADLSYGVFEYAQLQGADLRKVKLRSCWLRETDLSGAKMTGA